MRGRRRHPKITGMRGNAWVWVFVVSLGVASCDIPQETTDEIACTTLCRCATTLPNDREECVSECIGDIGPVSDPCAECVSLHANECTTVFADCNPICFPARPQEGAP